MAKSRLPFPLSIYTRPPAGLTDEWHGIYLALIEPISKVLMFRPDDARRGTCDLFKPWLETLRNRQAAATTVLQFLHGRSNRAWTAGQAIIDVTRPISTALANTIRFLSAPTPTPRGAEATANSLRADIADKLEAIEAMPFLDELAAAVVADCTAQKGRPVDTGTGPSQRPASATPPSTLEAPWPEYMSAKDLAERLGLPREGTRKKLERLADKYDCSIENESPRRGECRRLYRTADVLPHLR